MPPEHAARQGHAMKNALLPSKPAPHRHWLPRLPVDKAGRGLWRVRVGMVHRRQQVTAIHTCSNFGCNSSGAFSRHCGCTAQHQPAIQAAELSVAWPAALEASTLHGGRPRTQPPKQAHQAHPAHLEPLKRARPLLRAEMPGWRSGAGGLGPTSAAQRWPADTARPRPRRPPRR